MTRRGFLPAAALLVAGLAACGSTNNSGTTTNASSQLTVAQCMRTHGVPRVPDPTFPAGGGIAVKVPSGVDSSSPAFQQAREDCRGFR
jgi:hypothetical protein